MTPELGRRIGFTIGALLVYRLGTHIPLPGIDLTLWASLYQSSQGGVLGLFSALSGGAVGRLAIFALGIMPYITAAVLLQVLMIFSARFKAFAWRGHGGRSAAVRYTRALAVLLAAAQAYGIAVALEGVRSLVSDPGLAFRVSTVLTLTGGTAFLIWLSDQITTRGIGNGIALILFVGIALDGAAAVAGTLELGGQGTFSPGLLLGLVLLMIAVTALVASVERARRRVPVAYSAAPADRPRSDGGAALSLKLNNAGIIPPLLASWVIAIAITVIYLIVGREFDSISAEFRPGRPWYMAVYAVLIILCTFFYTAFVLDPDEAAADLKKYGAAVPGVDPGERTAQYLDGIVSRTTVVGALYLAAVCLIPELLIPYAGVPFYFGGTSLLIVVCTLLDIDAQVRNLRTHRDPNGDDQARDAALIEARG